MLIQLHSTGDWVNPKRVETLTTVEKTTPDGGHYSEVVINGVVFESDHYMDTVDACELRDQIAKEINAALQGK